jgi:hypothetical protein
VKVCDRWLDKEHGFDNFLTDMGERPPKHSLSRFLDTGNYEPGNVEWATAAQQHAEAKGKLGMTALHNFHEQEKQNRAAKEK